MPSSARVCSTTSARRPTTTRRRSSDAPARALTMICANPDLMVERGGRMIYCAGAIARAYEALGGKVEYAGKPYLPIYALHVRNAGEAEARQRRQGCGCSPSATASAPTLPVLPRPTCTRCSSPAGCMSKAASTARPSRPCFRRRAAPDRRHDDARLVCRRACLTARAGGPIYPRCPTRTRARPRRRRRRRRPR